MDGSSTDNTPAILKEYAAKHDNIIWRSEPDQCQWHALDKALAVARGEYVTMLCGQDGYLDRSWFERCVRTFNQHPEVSLVWGVPFNMSEDGKLIGPHYAYAGFLRDGSLGLQTKPVSTLAAKLDWRKPKAWKRFWSLLRKLTWPRVRMVLHSFLKQEIPQKENWFLYWLKTGRAFPEGNMIMRKEILLRTTKRFPKEKMTNAALFDLSFNFNAGGYLSYGLPVAASFSRSHTEGQNLREYDDILTSQYRKRISAFRESLNNRADFSFIDINYNVVSRLSLR